MADNYIENKFEELRARKAKEERAKEVAWKKRMDAYRKRLAAEAKLQQSERSQKQAQAKETAAKESAAQSEK